MSLERVFDSDLDHLKKTLMMMGGLVEHALQVSTEAFSLNSPQKFSEVHQVEEKINQGHKEIDQICLNILAKQGPVAKDLRWVVSCIKINADLERMGDQCVNMAYTGKDYFNRKTISLPKEIPEMSQIVRKMVKDSLDSFIREDMKLAREILLMDDQVDHRKDSVFQNLSNYIEKNPTAALAALDLILVARNLERIGDHSTNIAEDVIFVSTGKDIRHGGEAKDTSTF